VHFGAGPNLENVDGAGLPVEPVALTAVEFENAVAFEFTTSSVSFEPFSPPSTVLRC
jgi:hypothetical protein